jgi:hypothetical protein
MEMPKQFYDFMAGGIWHKAAENEHRSLNKGQER